MKDFQIAIEVSNKNESSVQMRCRLKGNEVDIVDGLCHVFRGDVDLHSLFMVACLGSGFPFNSNIISDACKGNEKIIIECEGGNLSSVVNGSKMSRVTMLSVSIGRSKGLTKIVETALKVFNEHSDHKKEPFDENVESMHEIIDEYKQSNNLN